MPSQTMERQVFAQLKKEAITNKYEGLLGIRDAIQETLAKDDSAILKSELELELARVVRTLEFLSVDVIQDRMVTS